MKEYFINYDDISIFNSSITLIDLFIIAQFFFNLFQVKK